MKYQVIVRSQGIDVAINVENDEDLEIVHAVLALAGERIKKYRDANPVCEQADKQGEAQG